MDGMLEDRSYLRIKNIAELYTLLYTSDQEKVLEVCV
jgi:hypothetical protein